MAYNITADGTPMGGVWAALNRTLTGFVGSGSALEGIAIGANWTPPAGMLYTFVFVMPGLAQQIQCYDGGAWNGVVTNGDPVYTFVWYQQDDTPAAGTLRFDNGGAALAVWEIYHTWREVGI